MKRARFVGTAKDDLSRFPEAVRRRAGYETQRTAVRDLELARKRYLQARMLAEE